MKKLFVLVAVAATITLASCSASKHAMSSSSPNYPQQWTQTQQTSKPPRIKVEVSECERMSMDLSDGRLKAFASAVDEDKDFARQQASALAKGQLVADIKARVTNILKIYRGSTAKDGAGTSGRNAGQTVDIIAEEVTMNCSVICSQPYMIGDKYEYEVCVCQMGTLEEAAKKAVLSDDAALKVKFDEEQFRKAYAEELERYRQSKANY